MAVKKFVAAPAIVQPMMDDQKTTIHWAPVESDGSPGAIASGATSPVTSVSPGTALKLDASADPTGLNVAAIGIHGQQGTEVVSVTYTNPDGSTATGQVTFNMTVDPKELDVAGFSATVDPPVSQ